MKTSGSPSPLGQAIRAANHERAKQDDQTSGLPESSNTRKPEHTHTSDEQVNLSIKVGKGNRLHWLLEAKKQGTSLTEAITEALNARFGTAPQDETF